MTAHKKPVIGYTGGYKKINPLQFMIALSIRIAGGKPLRLRHDKPHFDKHIDGLVVGGGTDIDPKLYKAKRKADYLYDNPRDEMELKWLRRAEDDNLPLLGICRGAQLMNVHRGGTLFMDMEKIFENAKYPSGLMAYIFYRKHINVKLGTILRKLMGRDNARVNSIHKQAIDKLGEGLTVNAVEKNGVIQGIEDLKKPFYVGVQFHPELLIYSARFRSLFTELVNTSRAK
jgi:putative glutamine amidotransferase